MSKLSPLPLKDQSMLDQRGVWAALADAHRHLAELKGICGTISTSCVPHGKPPTVDGSLQGVIADSLESTN